MNIIVTGASRGVGNALVKKLAATGEHQIIAISRDKNKLTELTEACLSANEAAQVFPIAYDLSNAEMENGLLPGILDCFGEIDILINNAGLLINKNYEELSDTDFDALFDVNVKAVFRITKLLLPYFSKPAHIVNIGSMGGVQGSAKFPGLSLYSAAKGAVVILTEAMAEEFRERAIKVNCLAFGAVQTEMLEAAFPGYKAPLQPDQMAEFVTGFALTGHNFFNGKTLQVSVSTP
jgi:3-oxoacyl-[acyl-carrier protein] reductase